ncbi:hypothetical protein ACTQ49_10285 [Luteococcus sp. Sow4_B9]|uniref:hypothetical protein n=1 Tax=Luteococcus sp. Sow4_B9 TaxID=3438792 RepID=UPI003F94C98A
METVSDQYPEEVGRAAWGSVPAAGYILFTFSVLLAVLAYGLVLGPLVARNAPAAWFIALQVAITGLCALVMDRLLVEAGRRSLSHVLSWSGLMIAWPGLAWSFFRGVGIWVFAWPLGPALLFLFPILWFAVVDRVTCGRADTAVSRATISQY